MIAITFKNATEINFGGIYSSNVRAHIVWMEINLVQYCVTQKDDHFVVAQIVLKCGVITV